MSTIHRIPDPANWPTGLIDGVHEGDSLEVLKQLPDECVAAAITSPPYWDVVDYGVDGQIGPGGYEQYLAAMLEIWRETTRVLIPNGKLAIVTPIMPIPKDVIGDQHTRHLKNIGSDIEFSIMHGVRGPDGQPLGGPVLDLYRYSLFIWQKQTTKKMFGSYPYPPNIYEDNTVEFIHVFVKDGPPPALPGDAKIPSEITQEEWRNLTMQVWGMYPADVKRARHPAPFPVVLPQRLIRMYTFGRAPSQGFAGDIVLDMFNGSGSTTLAAKALDRPYIGIDLSPDYCKVARERLEYEHIDPNALMLPWQKVRAPQSSRVSQDSLFDSEE